nr:MAG TPA: hypothetical protein [Caudoviricetes sp.]
MVATVIKTTPAPSYDARRAHTLPLFCDRNNF